MKVSFEGVGEQVLSFNKASGVTKGALVKMSANSTVKACDAGDRFMGVCIASGDAFAEIKTAGYVELGYSGTAPTVGYATLAADAAAGRRYVVLRVEPVRIFGAFSHNECILKLKGGTADA